MSDISTKLTYLNTTKGKLKDVINMTDANIDNQTTFRNYAQALYNGYINVLKDRNTLLDNMPKSTSTGSISEGLGLPVYEDKMSKLSTQETPTYKGLLKIPKALSQTKNGLKFVVNNDNSVTVTGTSSEVTTIDLLLETPLILNGTYTFSLKTVGTISSADQQQWLLYSGTISNMTNISLNPTVVSNSTQVKKNTVNNTATILRIYTTANRTLNCTIYPILEEGDTATAWESMPTNTTPNPSYPQEVKTVKGYRNLFDGEIELGGINPSDGSLVTNNSRTRSVNFIKVNPNTKYMFERNQTGGYRWIIGYTENKEGISDGNYSGNASAIYSSAQSSTRIFSFTTTATTQYIKWYDTSSTNVNEEVMINEGNTLLPYVPYGTNWIYTTISDGTNTKNIPIPLNNNEIAGIGDYKDEYIVDKNGHCWLNKKIGKDIVDGTGGWDMVNDKTNSLYIQRGYTTVYSLTPVTDIPVGLSSMFEPKTANSMYSSDIVGFTFTTNGYLRINVLKTIAATINEIKEWLNSNNFDLYYKLETPQLIDLNYNVDLTLYEGINNITNSEDMDMAIKYIKNVYE